MENFGENKKIFFEGKIREFLRSEARLRCRIEILELEVEGLRGGEKGKGGEIEGLECENGRLESKCKEFLGKCLGLEGEVKALEGENLSLVEGAKRASEKNRALVAECEIKISSRQEKLDAELEECKSEYAYQ